MYSMIIMPKILSIYECLRISYHFVLSLSGSVSVDESLLPNFILFWMCFHSRLNQSYFDLNCSTEKYLTSIFLTWNSFFDVIWISSNIFTFECQPFQYSSPPNGVITSSVLWIKYNFREVVRVLICPSQLCFPFLFRRSSCFSERHLEIGIPVNPAKI